MSSHDQGEHTWEEVPGGWRCMEPECGKTIPEHNPRFEQHYREPELEIRPEAGEHCLSATVRADLDADGVTVILITTEESGPLRIELNGTPVWEGNPATRAEDQAARDRHVFIHIPKKQPGAGK